MSDKTGIEWTDATWNPVTGCTKVSQGCKHCYAERDWARLAANPATKYAGRAFTDVATHRDTLALPCRWSKPRRVFVNSMSDLFHEAVPFEFIAAVFGVMAAASWHTFQVLTKRPQRALDFFAWLDAHPERAHFDTRTLQKRYPGADWRPFLLFDIAADLLPDSGNDLRVDIKRKWPLPNVWLGVSVEDQAAANERVPLLLKMPAAVRFLSVEPMLGPVDIRFAFSDAGVIRCPRCMFGTNRLDHGPCPNDGETLRNDPGVHWVICGGESGPRARPMHPEWARDLRDQCTAAGVPFLFKQWGEWGTMPGHGAHYPAGIAPDGSRVGAEDRFTDDCALMYRVGKKAAGRLLDGVEHNGYPEVRHGD